MTRRNVHRSTSAAGRGAAFGSPDGGSQENVQHQGRGVARATPGLKRGDVRLVLIHVEIKLRGEAREGGRGSGSGHVEDDAEGGGRARRTWRVRERRLGRGGVGGRTHRFWRSLGARSVAPAARRDWMTTFAHFTNHSETICCARSPMVAGAIRGIWFCRETTVSSRRRSVGDSAVGLPRGGGEGDPPPPQTSYARPSLERCASARRSRERVARRMECRPVSPRGDTLFQAAC